MEESKNHRNSQNKKGHVARHKLPPEISTICDTKNLRKNCPQLFCWFRHLTSWLQKWQKHPRSSPGTHNRNWKRLSKERKAAYDAIGHKRFLTKISSKFPKWAAQVISPLLQKRHFRARIGDHCSTWRKQKNVLLLGSVLAPVLFNLFTHDLPVIESRKFIYAQDILHHFPSSEIWTSQWSPHWRFATN